MKTYLLALLMLCAISNFAIAQTTQSSDTSYSKDPQISDQNYKHPDKATAASKSGKNKHIKTSTVQGDDNTNYKQSFKHRSVRKEKISTEIPSDRKKVKRNYKNQF